MYKKAKILFFCMIFVAGGVFGQNYAAIRVLDTDIFNVKLSYLAGNNITFQNYFQQSKNKIQEKRVSGPKALVYKSALSPSIIAADFYTCNFGFFCKKELRFEKATKILLRFRLGTLQYNDYMEGKPNSGILSAY